MNKLFVIVILLITGAITIFFVNYKLIDNSKENWLSQREIVHNQATRTFQTRIERYASIVSGLRSYMINKDVFPNEAEMQDFLKSHISDLNFKDSVIISYLDSNHNFIYSISNNRIDPSSLVGINVGDYLSDGALRNLEKVFVDERLHLYQPINLREEWVGISFNFSVREEQKVVGYVTAIVNFQGIIQELYAPQLIEDFCHHFTTSDGLDFDRERVHGTKIFHDRHDPEYYKNFDILESDFLYSNIELYGQKFRIGTSYKKPFTANLIVPIFSSTWYLIFAVMIVFIARQSGQMNRLNKNLSQKNEEVEQQKEEIEFNNLQLREANASKDKFFSIIGHDLSSPLRTIQSLISMRRNEMISSEETENFLGDLDRVNSKTVDLLDNLLEWATLGHNKGKTHFQKLSLNTIIEEIIMLNHGASDLKTIKVSATIEDDLEIEGDANMIAVVLRNVLSNALKFTHTGGLVNITAEDHGEVVKITISDSGVGLSKKRLENIFRIDKGPSPKGTYGELGTGLGLVLCKEYVDLHHGDIWAESAELKGTTFFITLPKTQK